MQPSQYKESRIASIQMLFGFFKSLPTSYYLNEDKMLDDGTSIVKNINHVTLKKTLNYKKCGFDTIEISGVYLCAYDQKVLRAILQCIYKQQEVLYKSSEIKASILNKECIPESKSLYSSRSNITVKVFYDLINGNRECQNSHRFEKISNSLIRLSKTILSFNTKNHSKVLSAPLILFEKTRSMLSFQVHPSIMAFQFKSQNDQSLIIPKQDFYLIDNQYFFEKELSQLEQLLYSKIQYKFASMNAKYKTIELNFNQLKSELFLESKSVNTQNKQVSNLKKAIINLDGKFNYTLKKEGSRDPVIVVKKK